MRLFSFVALALLILPLAAFSQNDTTTKPPFTVVESMPEYPGGQDALMCLITTNLVYPATAKENGVFGTVYASFIVETDGTVSDLKILKGIGNGCDEEVLRVLKLMKKWKPGKQDGKKVRVQFNLPVKFALK